MKKIIKISVTNKLDMHITMHNYSFYSHCIYYIICKLKINIIYEYIYVFWCIFFISNTLTIRSSHIMVKLEVE